MKLKYFLFLSGLIAGFFAFVYVVNATDACPHTSPWIKEDSDDLSKLPAEYEAACFKFGSENSQGCIGGISNTWPPAVDGKYCGLSHFSYIPKQSNSPTPTNFDESPTPTAGASATLTPTNSVTPSVSPTPSPTETPTVSEQQWSETRRQEGEVFGVQK